MAAESSGNVTHVNDDIDIIDEFCLVSAFDEAAKYLSSNSKLKLSNTQRLHFYALFKQATVGPCNKPQPSILDFTERAKWSAWHDLANMSKDVAVVEYINAVEQIAPQWKDDRAEQNDTADDDDEDDNELDGLADKGSGGGNGGFGISASMSRPADESVDDSSREKDICYFAERRDVGGVNAALTQTLPTYQDSDGRTALHIAADRGYYDIASAVISAAERAQPPVLPLLLSLRDQDGATALQYACICDNTDIAVLLVKKGALWDETDSNGESAWTAASLQLREEMTKAKRAIDKNDAQT